MTNPGLVSLICKWKTFIYSWWYIILHGKFSEFKGVVYKFPGVFPENPWEVIIFFSEISRYLRIFIDFRYLYKSRKFVFCTNKDLVWTAPACYATEYQYIPHDPLKTVINLADFQRQSNTWHLAINIFRYDWFELLTSSGSLICYSM